MDTVRYERIPSTDPRLNRHIRHDPRSRRYPFDTRGIGIAAVRHQRYVPVFDQRDLGDCVANAGLGCMATGPYWATWQALTRPPYPMTQQGVTSNYIDLTAVDDIPGQYRPGDPASEDTGSDGLSEAKLFKTEGVIAGYQHTFSLDAALKALQVYPLTIGTLWLSDMFQPRPDGLIHATGSVAGGHQYIADEYDPVRGWVGLQNSWSSTWGLGGRFYLQAEDLGYLLERDGDVTVFTPNGQPAPQPSPVPAPPISADETFAGVLHRWLDSRPRSYLPLQQSAEAWLVGKHL